MKNKEKFAKEILDIACSGDCIALANGKLVPCETIPCTYCYFSKNVISCKTRIKEWAESEYEELKIQPEVKNCKVDDRILVSDNGEKWFPVHYAGHNEQQELVFAWKNGCTSWSMDEVTSWDYAKLPESEV